VDKEKLGLIYGVAAYGLWGLFPLYWPLLEEAGPFEIVSHRAVWTLVFCGVILGFTKSFKTTFSLLRKKGVAIRLTLAAIFISVNWLVFIWAVNHGHVVESSLGYYINPIFMIAFGVLLLKEKMRKLQWVATLIAFIGVLILAFDYGRLPWVALALALSWGSYGVVKKQLGLNALQGLAIETAISSIPYLAYLIYIAQKGTGHFGHGISVTLLLIGAGAVTAIPLLFFNGAATRLPLTSMGLLQYITPSLLFALGVWIKHEDMSPARWGGFFVIWIALITLAVDLLKSGRTVNNSVNK
jgi:chloramphenicol-sensitive protein RarD